MTNPAILRRCNLPTATLLLSALAAHVTAQQPIPGPACPGNTIANGGFHLGLTPPGGGSMPAAALANWQWLTNTPQIVPGQGNLGLGCIQMWGNQAVGESIKQLVPGGGFVANNTYQISFSYRWLNNNPTLPPNVAFRLCASAANPTGYPATSGNPLITLTPLSNSTTWVNHTVLWTPTANAAWLTINPENQHAVNDGNFVSWGQIDDLCIRNVSGCPNTIVTNGSFTQGLVPGSMPGASVAGWSLLSASPQVVDTQGCAAPGCIQMWGNQVVGESIRQTLPGVGFVAGRTYRVSFSYRWLDNNPNLPQYVQIRAAATNALTGYPATSGYQVIALTPPTSVFTTWVAHSVLFTPSTNMQYLTFNPENAFNVNDGNFVSWGQLDDVCVQDVTNPGHVYDLGPGCGNLSLSAVTAPVIGATAVTELSGIPSGAPLGLHLLSFTAFNPGIDLSFLGLPGCVQYSGLDSVELFLVGGTSASHSLSIPADPSFVGVQIARQSVVNVPGINPFGAIVSNGLCWIIGDHD
ncbi:MAG: hypothetical protein MUC36_18285 [Planctomycetes bacterium]|jgi:hypothetical protein|nr:hypothetical protein [Planctomycetota bacterium]